MRCLFAFVCSMLLIPPATAQPKPIRILAEAEDFTIKQGAWDVVPYRENYFAATFAISFLSRGACLGAPAQVERPALASQKIDVPEDGVYQVMARYEQPFNFSVEFSVSVEQGGVEVYREMFGKLEDPRIWPLNGHKRKPMERFSWGGTDNIVWQEKGGAALKKGPATLHLIAGPQLDGRKPRVRAAARHVDVICLHNDAAGAEAQKKTNYLEFDGWLTQAGDLHVRVTNPKDAIGPVVPIIAPFDQGQHSPYYIHVRDWPTTRIIKSGRLVDDVKYQLTGPRLNAVSPALLAPIIDPAKFVLKADPKQKPIIPADEYLQPGDVSGWVPMGQVLDSLNACQWFPMVQTPKGTEVHLGLEFAIPDGKGGLTTIKSITVRGQPGNLSPVTFEMPANSAPNPRHAAILNERFWPPVIRTQKEALDWLNAEVAKFPKVGKRPERMLFYSILGFSGALDHFDEAKQLALALGDNTAVNTEGKQRRLVAHWGDPKVDSIKKHEATKPGDFKDLKIVSYGDEIHLPAIAPTQAEFADWLKARGVVYEGEVKYVPPGPKNIDQPLYYYSHFCAREKGGKHYAAGTAYYESKGILTGANYSPHANYLINDLDYVRPFKMKAMTMPWGEDYIWQIPDFSVQVMGYLTSGFRAGAKYHDLPIHMYVMPHSPGATPKSFRMSYYTTIAHGAKMINYFCASPSAIGSTENYVDTNDLGIWRELHRCTHEAGIFEDYVMDGKVRPAKVGLLLSSVDDVYTGVNNFALAMHNNERKALYLALRHQQIPVDFVTEDDVIEGLANDYRVIYVTAQWLHSKGIASLKKWAEAGGTVVARGGGGFKDEFNRPSSLAGAFYGVKSQELTVDPDLYSKYLTAPSPFFPKQDLPVCDPLTTASWSFGDRKVEKAEVLVWRQKLEPADANVVGRYADGSPAVLEKAHGKGRVILFGFLPGQAYLKSGLPLRPVDRGAVDGSYAHFLPTAMDMNVGRAITEVFLPKNFTRPVDCDAALVEATCIDTKTTRLAVPLINYAGKAFDKLTVRINGVDRFTRVQSVQRGPLTGTIREGRLEVSLPLDVADMILVDR